MELLHAAQTPGLRLDLRRNRLSDTNIRDIADTLTSNDCIVGLRLDGNQDDGDATILQHKKIEFHLRKNSKQQQRMHAVHRIQQIHHSALEVQTCHFDHVSLSIADAELLKLALRDNRSVTDLRFMSNALPAEGTKRILHGLHANVSVRKLAIIDNNVGSVGMHALSVLLRQQQQKESKKKPTSALRSLTISNSIHLTLENGLLEPITRRTASALHFSFANYAAITSLSLANCGLTDRDIGVIVSGIAWGAQLEELDLRNNGFGDHCVHVFVCMLHRCRLFHRLDLVRRAYFVLTLPDPKC